MNYVACFYLYYAIINTAYLFNKIYLKTTLIRKVNDDTTPPLLMLY